MTEKSGRPTSGEKNPKTQGPKIIKLKPKFICYRAKDVSCAKAEKGAFYAAAKRRSEARPKAGQSQTSKGRAKNYPDKSKDCGKGRKATKA